MSPPAHEKRDFAHFLRKDEKESMVFSSIFFLFVYLPIVLALYYVVPRRFKNLLLFVCSLIFYAWGEPVYILVMLFTAFIDYFNGAMVDRFRDRPAITKAFVFESVIVNLSLLGFFKYSGLLVSTFNSATGLSVPVPEVTLPIGISFYTFQSMSYTIDIYRNRAPRQHHIVDYGTYVSFFPYLVAGPIVRYEVLALQVMNRQETLEKFTQGAQRFLVGLFKKVILANNVAALADKVQFYGDPSTLSAWLGILAFTFQIYFDFSGYSDMAIGLGKMFGFSLPENFNLPYISHSVREFWTRWHMTLGTWFKEYVYFPLGGSRRGTLITVRNMAIVWTLTGVWHGASWNYAMWGAYFGVLIICEKLFLGKWLEKWPRFLSWLYSFLAVVIGWVFFSYTDITKAFSVLGAMFGVGAPLYDDMGLYNLLTFLPMLLLAAFCSTPYAGRITEKMRQGPLVTKVIWSAGVAVLFVACTAMLVDNSYNPFLYFQF